MHSDTHSAHAELMLSFSKREIVEEAVRELEEIVERMENDELDIDQLSEQLKRAKTLVKLCKDKLTKTDEEIKKLLSED